MIALEEDKDSYHADISPSVSSCAIVTLNYSSCIIHCMLTCRLSESNDIIHSDTCVSILYDK